MAADRAFDAGRLAATVPPAELVDLVEPDGAGAARPVLDITHDSREVRPGWAFACVPGRSSDGHAFAADAVAAGASALLVERVLALDVSQVVVRDVRRVLGSVAAAVHGHPARRLRTVGVTGTNGKTTTTHLLGAILRAAGLATQELGTLTGVRTTPEATDLQRRLADLVDDGVDAVVMEVSSHALALHRVAGMRFDVSVFTNLGRDHFDLHESVEEYFRAKASLFTPALTDVGIVNFDDPYGQLLADVAEIETVGFSLDDADDVSVGLGAIDFVWRGHRVHVPIGGAFNVPNALAALTAAERLGIDAATAIGGLATATRVPGRFEVVSDEALDPFSVVVDYAHTPDGLTSVLGTARAVAPPNGRVVVVFGCGGDRDTDKRGLMGAAAVAGADAVVVTSDNPRHEDPSAIIDAIVAGIDPRDRIAVVTEADRRRAIELALGVARAGDVVVIAGKGHETTQTVGDEVRPFDDRAVARELLREMAGESGKGGNQ